MAVTGAGLLTGLVLARAIARRRTDRKRSARLGHLGVWRTRVAGVTMHARVSLDPVPGNQLPVIWSTALGCPAAT
jgi:hypothetical protein